MGTKARSGEFEFQISLNPRPLFVDDAKHKRTSHGSFFFQQRNCARSLPGLPQFATMRGGEDVSLISFHNELDPHGIQAVSKGCSESIRYFAFGVYSGSLPDFAISHVWPIHRFADFNELLL
jgi:hypothetical protein